jgi:hypothetical protein
MCYTWRRVGLSWFKGFIALRSREKGIRSMSESLGVLQRIIQEAIKIGLGSLVCLCPERILYLCLMYF